MNSYNDLCYEDIKEKCIIKTSHASGWNVVVDDKKDVSEIIKKLGALGLGCVFHEVGHGRVSGAWGYQFGRLRRWRREACCSAA
jgi:hypothetical protein